MDNTQTVRAGIATAVPFLGAIALSQFALFHVVGEAGTNGIEAFDPGYGEAASFLVYVYSLSAVPMILIALGLSTITRWVTVGVCGLLTLYHALHVVEHVGEGDVPGVAIIVVTALIPYGIAIWLLLKPSKASE
ncbi:MAG: hypothetical protein AAF986_11330 [Pseudomonadota bacterium]